MARAGGGVRTKRRASWGTWLVCAVLAVAMATVLAVTGVVNADIGSDAVPHDQGPTDAVPADVARGGVVVDGRTAPAHSVTIPDRTVALTFDDGPDPTWTPQILAVLAKHRVPGTFFVVGSLAAKHPELLRDIRAAGGEIGVHTFSHVDLSTVPEWRFQRELDETQFAITGATGETSYLLRPPFSSTVDAIDDASYRGILRSGAQGYVNVFTSFDGEDWERPGVEAILRFATPPDGRGGTILLHDAGGDRSQTVAALDRLIPQLQAQGYRFDTVTGAAGLPDAHAQAPSRDQLVGGGLVAAVDLATTMVRVLLGFVLFVGLVVVARLLGTLLVARAVARRRRDPAFSWGEPVGEPVSVIVPAYNESENIEATLRSILANDHPLEIVVVDDGSGDGTAELVESLGLPAVRVIRQVNSGKPIALNTGVAAARHDLVVMMDGDTVFQPDTIARIVAPFADPTVGAVAGNVKVANRTALVPRLQHIEYVVGFGIDRRVQDRLGSITTIPGAAGAFRREAVLAVGGLSLDTLAEDTDLTIALGRAGWRVVFAEQAVAWTEAPTTLAQLWRQRYRWTYGTMQAAWKHRRSLRERGASGRVGRLGIGHIGLFQVLFPLAAPLVDLFFVYGVIFGDAALAIALWVSMLLVQTAAAAAAFRLDGEPLAPLWVAPLQQILYRPLMYAVLVRSLLSAVMGGRVRWQRIQRLGAFRALVPGATPVAAAGGAPAGAVDPARAIGAASPAALVTSARTVAAVPGGADGGSTPPAGDTGKPDPGPGERTRWLDVLRAVALVRVFGYHVLGWTWLSIVFPSMGVMFALAGSLMVASLRRAEAVDVIGRRIKRLLPPFWLFGLLVVPVMFWFGWTAEESGPPEVSSLLFWAVPILDPPGSEWGETATVVLWYIRTYLWLVLLTPVLLWAWRRRPALALGVPLGIVALDAVLGGAIRDFGDFTYALTDACIFAGCWMLGFAHRDGSLRRLPMGRALGFAVAAIGLGLAWAFTHPAEGGVDLNDIPLGQALVSLGAVLIVLRWTPRLAWVEQVPGLGRLITVINARAVTIYLWHNIAIAAAVPVNDAFGWDSTPAVLVGTSLVLTVVAMLALGWAEDLAAGRRPALFPGPAQRALRPREPRLVAPAPPVLHLPAETEESSLAALNALRPASDFRRDPEFAEPVTFAARRPLPGLVPHPSFPPVPVAAGAPSRPGAAGRPAAAATARPGPPTSAGAAVPDSRRAGPSSHPGTAVRPPSGGVPWPASRPPSPARSRRAAPEPDPVTNVVGRAPTGRRRHALTFGAAASDGSDGASLTADVRMAPHSGGRTASGSDPRDDAAAHRGAVSRDGRHASAASPARPGSHRRDDEPAPVGRSDPPSPSRHRR